MPGEEEIDWELVKDKYKMFSVFVFACIVLAALTVERDPLPAVLLTAFLLALLALVYRHRLLDRSLRIPLPGFLERELGNACADCGRGVERGTLRRRADGKWVCPECLRKGEGAG